MNTIKNMIDSGNVSIGIELGSTRIKAILIDNRGHILAIGEADWENQLINDIWTYNQNDIWIELQNSYKDLMNSVKEKYNTVVRRAIGIGISGMMHGYMPFDRYKNQLVPFRTWRNNTTSIAAKELTQLFNYNIPQRWSIAHLYQAILNQEEHVDQIDYITTLAGYIHWCLTGKKVLGIGEASGMFPIDIQSKSYNVSMLQSFNQLIKNKNYCWSIEKILPQILIAGQNAGKLTEKGAKLLDPTGALQAGINMCPPEGDAGTGMVATNSIKENTGNISAGTSAFAMVVLEKELSKAYAELDMITTPTGKLVAMAHANNCTSDINAWIKLFGETLEVFGAKYDPNQIYEKLFIHALEKGEVDCGGLLAYGFYSGEHNIGLSMGCPIFIHPVNTNFNLANFIRIHLYTAFGAMKLGMDILMKQEKIKVSHVLAHGGIFKTKNVVSKILASAINTPVAVMEMASEGGAWGIALLANYLEKFQLNQSLEQYLENIFSNVEISLSEPEYSMSEGYEKFMLTYKKGIPIVREAIKLNA
ncbi:xylulokinase [Pasteurella testudinis]|uniref:xylulokinase n=1 Tax=Pasteurella testudinis TaxID=761 RepID=UPI004059D489